MSKYDWVATKKCLEGKLSDEESHIVEMLIQGKTQAEIGRIIAQHRSMIWRKTERIKNLLPNP